MDGRLSLRGPICDADELQVPPFFWLLKKKKSVLNQKLAFTKSQSPVLGALPAMLVLMQREGQRSVSVICSGKACRIFTELCDPLGAFFFVCDQRQSGI